MKRIITITLIVLISTIASAQQPRRMRPDGPPPPPPRLDEFLNLTPDQQTQIDALHQSQRATVEPLFEAKRAEDEKLRAMLESPAPDPTAIGRQVLAIHAIDQQIKAAHDATEQKVSALLTPDQRVRFEAMLALRRPPERR